MASEAVPVFDTVTLDVPLFPTATVPNVIVDADNETVGVPGVGLPEPLIAMVCAAAVALLATLIVAP